MIEFAVVSGKGGTGKTTLSASLAVLIGSKVLADADVDAPCLHLLLKPQINSTTDFYGMKTAVIDQKKCTSCDICRKICRFDAINVIDGKYSVDEVACDGCQLCMRKCPERAIRMEDSLAGHWFVSTTKYGVMVHGMLEVGQENSGKMVTVIRKQAMFIAQRDRLDYIIIDGPPGIGCPVNSTLTGIRSAIAITEPTQSGLLDLKRLLDLMKHFNIQPFVIINKYDLNPEKSAEITSFVRNAGYSIVGKIPFDEKVVEALSHGIPIVEYDSKTPAAAEIIRIWDKIKELLK